MINWNFDVESAKSEGWVLVCLDDEQRTVIKSCWLEKENRWNMIGTNETPHAWSHINHPLSDTPYLKPTIAASPAPTLPVGMNVSLPPGIG